MFTIIGADGKEYGPVSPEQVRQWIAEGRVNAQTRIKPAGTADWRTVGDFPELMGPATPGTGTAGVPPSSPGVFVSAPVADTGRALAAVNGPATGLIIVGALFIVGAAFGLISALTGGAMRTMGNPELDRLLAASSGVMGVLSALITAAVGGVTVYGAMKMKRLESFGLAITASILAMLPCSICCLIGLPIGIWSLVVLNKPEVKSAFR